MAPLPWLADPLHVFILGAVPARLPLILGTQKALLDTEVQEGL
ncbi:hypothetical protein [Arthrobacter sp. FW305-BF8]|nr:hypothetical protein [Arthrobacter sp. FW305-BF8]